MKKKILGCVAIALSMWLFGLIVVFSFGNSFGLTAIAESDDIPQVGSVITFGNFTQDFRGLESTPIEWVVLDVNNNKVSLMSKEILDARPFHETDDVSSWRASDLRKWLNGEFLKNAFSTDEQKMIFSIQRQNSSDKIGIMTLKEVQTYFHDMPSYTNETNPLWPYYHADMTDYANGSFYGHHESKYAEFVERKEERGGPIRQSWWTMNIWDNHYWVDTVGEPMYVGIEVVHYPCTQSVIGVRPTLVLNWNMYVKTLGK